MKFMCHSIRELFRTQFYSNIYNLLEKFVLLKRTHLLIEFQFKFVLNATALEPLEEALIFRHLCLYFMAQTNLNGQTFPMM